MSDDPRHDVTRILQKRDGDPAEELLPLVYAQLRAIAQQRMSSERAGHTLQATALVHEVYVRLLGDSEQNFENRRHFFAAAAEAMRRILIDHARRKGSKKRGGDRHALPISVVDLAEDHDPERILALDEALETLRSEDPRAAQVIELRFYAGLGIDETAEIMGISRRTVIREWTFARTRIFQMLQGEEE